MLGKVAYLIAGWPKACQHAELEGRYKHGFKAGFQVIEVIKR